MSNLSSPNLIYMLHVKIQKSSLHETKMTEFNMVKNKTNFFFPPCIIFLQWDIFGEVNLSMEKFKLQ